MGEVEERRGKGVCVAPCRFRSTRRTRRFEAPRPPSAALPAFLGESVPLRIPRRCRHRFQAGHGTKRASRHPPGPLLGASHPPGPVVSPAHQPITHPHANPFTHSLYCQ